MKKYLTLLLFLIPLGISAQQLIYRPVNPAFGGDTFNYQWLLNSANAQNGFTAPADELTNLTDLERFTENLNRQLLGQVSRNLLNLQVGENGLQPGTFAFGSLELEIFDSTEGLVINILDTNTGDQTQIIVPN